MSDVLARACEFFDAGRYDLAEALFLRELQRQPTSVFAQSFLSLCSTVRKQFSEGELIAREALKLDPNQFFPHYALACCLHDSNRLIEASAAAGLAPELDPKNAPTPHLIPALTLPHTPSTPPPTT